MSEEALIIRHDVDIVTHDEWISIEPSIKNTAVNIANSIKEAHSKIAKAKGLAKEAPNIKGGFLGFGKQKKITSALSESQVITNEAVTDLAELVQQSIGFTLQSVKTASNMQKALAYLAVNGIRDANGRVETLSTEVTESINEIIDSAQSFLQQQAELNERLEDQEAKDEEQDVAIKSMDKALKHFSENSICHELKLTNLQKLIDNNQSNAERNRRKLESLIEKNISSVVKLQATLYEYRKLNETQITNLEESLRAVIDSNKKLDEDACSQLKEEYLTEIGKLKRAFVILSCSIGAIAVLALILSIAL
jgi:hypothetical protein